METCAYVRVARTVPTPPTSIPTISFLPQYHSVSYMIQCLIIATYWYIVLHTTHIARGGYSRVSGAYQYLIFLPQQHTTTLFNIQTHLGEQLFARTCKIMLDKPAGMWYNIGRR